MKSFSGCRWLARMIEVMSTVAVAITIFGGPCSGARAAEWPQFRGPGGAGAGASAVPLTWSGTTSLSWKTALPGAGSSSPIVQGDRSPGKIAAHDELTATCGDGGR